MEVFILKKLILLLVLTIMTLLDSAVLAESDHNFTAPVCIMVNGSYIKTDTEPYLYDGVTYVPVRAVANALSSDSVIWNPETQNVIIQNGSDTVSLFIGKKTAYVNDKTVTVPGGAFIKNDRTYVPVRFVSESFGAEVLWDNLTYTVKISKNGISVPSEFIKKRSYTDDDLYWMARIINAESAGEPNLGKIAVGNVVINRVLSSDYPNTIYDVIFDTKYGVQFEPIINGAIYNTPTQSSIIAAKIALEGENVVSDSLFFLNESIAENKWIVANRPYFTTIGQHSFYL